MTEKKKPLLCYEFNQTSVDLINEMALESGGEIETPRQLKKHYNFVYPLIHAAVRTIAPNLSGTKQEYVTDKLICKAYFCHAIGKGQRKNRDAK